MARKTGAHQLQLEATVPAPSRTRARDLGEPRTQTGKAAAHSSAVELLRTPGALLTRTHLRGLGLERRAVDAVFRALPVVALPGYSRPMVRVEDYVELIERHTYRDDRVRPSRQTA
jgi:hypothetical protein